MGLGLLDVERLDVYQRAIEHLGFVFKSIPSLPRSREARRGEAMECGAIIDVIRLIGVVPESDLAAGKLLLVRVVGMLSKLCR